MWSSRHPSYSRDESTDGLQISPYLRASSALLTPPASYSLEARRNSTASTLSSLGPTTPICGRSPFSDHHLVSMSGVDMCQTQSVGSLGMNCTMKAPAHEDAFYSDWQVIPQPMSVEHGMPVRLHESFTTNTGFPQSMMSNYHSMGVATTSPDASCWNGFAASPYSSFNSQISNGSSEVGYPEIPHPAWSLSLQNSQVMTERTMVPSEAILGGEFIHVDANHDTDLSSYDDTDVGLPPTPQDVVCKQEGETSEDEKRVKRSIFISPTGGKTVKREQHPNGVTKKKPRKSRSKAINRLNDCRFELYLEEDVEPIPGTRRWRKTSGVPDKPQICQLLNPDGSPCGKPFKRQEHLHRHEKTHSGRKDFSCQMCNKKFNRNDNCWEHYWTHVLRPGKKTGRNDKCSLRRVLAYIHDPKHVEKLLNKWRKEVGCEYDPEEDLLDDTEEELSSAAAIKKEESHEESLRSKKSSIKSRL